MNHNTTQYQVPPGPHGEFHSSHLHVQKIPTFPLSSPIREEIPTPDESPGSSQLTTSREGNPFASSEDYFAQVAPFETDDAIQFGSQTEENHKTYKPLGETLQPGRPSRWDSIKRPGRTIMKRNPKEASANKKTRPGLNLVTNFSNDTKYRRDAVSKRRQSVGRGFIDLNDLKLLSKGKETAKPVNENRLLPERRPSSTEGYVEIKDSVTVTSRGLHATNRVKQMRKSPLDALRASPSKMQDLSPSDRPIMIGLSISYNNAGAVPPAKAKRLGDESTPIKNTLGSPNSQRSTNTTPITPTIVVTPAREDNPWDSFSGGGSPEKRHTRPASSIYSQPTPRVKDGRPPSIIPPVPAIPASHSVSKPIEVVDVFVDQASTPARRHRAFSVGTVFEDDSPVYRRASRPRSMSDESRLQVGKSSRYSIDTIATRPRSQGWWNLLLSPLLSRSNTIASKISFRSPQDETPPAVPPFPFAVSHSLQIDNGRYGEKHFEDEVSFFSPDTPFSSEEKESVWASAAGTVGKPSGEREGSDSDNDDEWVDDDCSQMSSRQSRDKTSHISTVSAQTIPFMISSPTSAGYTQENFHKGVHVPSTKEQIPSPLQSVSPDTGVFCNNLAAFPPVPGGNVRIQNKNPNNPFFQRFADSVRNGSDARERSNSDSTVIEDEPDVSPNVRQATVTPLLRAAPIGPFLTGPTAPLPPIPRRVSPRRVSPPPKSTDISPSPSVGTSNTQPPPYSPPKKITKNFRRYRALLPSDLQPQPQSLGPVSSETQMQMTTRNGILLSNIQQPQPPLATYSARNNSLPRGVLPPRPPNSHVHVSDVERPANVRANNEYRRQRLEREDQVARKVGGLWRGRGCFSNRGCFGRSGREGRNRRRWYVGIGAVLIVTIIVSVVLAVTLTRKRDDSPESRWLNLTGYPPMPTGVSTVAGPNAVIANSGCIRPSSMWSCALPKEKHDANLPFDPDQPNFRIQINFQNGTFIHSTIPSNQAARKRSIFTFLETLNSTPSALRRRRSLHRRGGGLSPIPAPPRIEEQVFLGNTSDGVNAPFAGEDTPFFATFLSPEPITISTRHRRDTPTPHVTDPDDLADAIPNPAHNPDGTAAPANLLPLPVAQPIRLYDRGLRTEHYGFYTYYDRSILLKADRPLNNDSNTSVVPDDKNGGSSRSAARFRCTWTQTRFLVQIWTSPSKNKMRLVPQSSATPSDTPSKKSSSSSPSPDSSTQFIHTSVTDFTRPGSFPYPITIALDRHGGDPSSKMVYCYQLDLEQRYIMDSKRVQIEDRGFGGHLVNPGLLLGSNNSSAGGFDGGEGGCRCEWRNWLTTR
ncbi:hypothetical protein AJ78_08339 [Emergomyces pasteurianus Ep9510]|uniref:Uncharacterized protein n=1 Tax=Emergomyces pasteurianus Ep9510 TaxID=1447872 RepID=A0A1J9P1S3_9EURO|nr:hypothetical protein AJ78_08339 [Emergomyces pasteurianus Ep9510]